MMKRIVGMAAVVSLLMLCILLPRVEGVGMYSIQTYNWYAFVDTSSGNHYTTASGGLVVAYEADLADTNGNGTNGTFYSTTADTGFYWGNLATNVYDFVFRNDTDTLVVAQNVAVWGRTIGDSTITDSAQFKPDVVGTHAIRDWAVHTAHLDSAAVTKSKMATQSVDSTQMSTGAIHPSHMDQAEDYTFGGLTVGGDAVFNDGIDINLPADDNIVVDGRTIPHTTTIGAMLWEHTPAVTGTRAITLNIDMDGYSDTHGMVTEYIATGMVAGNAGMPIEVDVDKANSTGGKIHALQVSETGTGTVDVAAVGVYSGVDPIHQHSGSDANVEHAWNYNGAYADITAAFASAAVDSQLFVANGDFVFVGNAALFDEIKFTLAVDASGAGVKPTFDYSTGVGTWSTFGPSDGTNGFRQNGDIAWESGDLAGWASVAVNGETKYWVRITRTQTVVSTPPTEDIVQSVSDTDYEWDEDGDVSIRNLDVGGTATIGTIVYPAKSILSAAVAWGAGGDSIDADDMAASATRLWAPAPGGAARIMVSDGSSVWQGVDPAGDVEIGPTGATSIQANVIDAERLESADNPASGDLVGVTAADAFTHQTPAERGLWTGGVPVTPDTVYYGTTDFVTDKWHEWKTGADSADVIIWGWSEEPPYRSSLGELSVFQVAVFCTTAGRIEFDASVNNAKTHGGTGMWYQIIIRP